MAEYQLTDTDVVIRLEDMASIPNDQNNRDRVAYDEWLAAGGVPDPAIEKVPPSPPVEDQVLFDHENRLRSLEGQPPLTLGDFAKMRGG